MATNIKLLDENALSAIKTYVDTKVGEAGKVDDVKINNATVVTSKVANIAVEGTYNASSNKIATQTTVSNAIGALDVSNISGFGAGKTLATLTETDGKIAATFQNITITESQVTNLTTDLATKVPTSRTIAGLALSSNITSASLIAALGLTQALVYIGVATTTKPSAGNYVQTVIGGTTYYVSLTSSGTATQVNAQKGQILTIGSKEYICTTAGASGTNVFSELGDESSYALKTISISAGSGLSGGGNLTQNRTISHATPTGASTKATGFYKFSTDSFGHVNGTTAVAKSDLTGLGVADNSLVVHLAGVETITGAKTFTTSMYFEDGTSISGNTNIEINGRDSDAYVKITEGDTDSQYFKVGALVRENPGGITTLTLPTTTGTLALTSQIPTNYVTTNTAQTISGKKTFSHADGIAISNTGATATLSVTNNSESGELSINGVSYLYLPRFAWGEIFGADAIWTRGGTNNILTLGSSEDGVLTLTNGDVSSSSHNGNVIYKTRWGDAVSTYGVQFPDTHGYTANRTLATTADIPSVSDFVTKSTAQSITGAKTFAANTLKLTGDHGTITTVSGGTGGEYHAGLTSSGNVIANGKLISFTGSKYTEYCDGEIHLVYATGTGGYNHTLTLPVKTDTVATLGDIPSLANYVQGPSSSTQYEIPMYNNTTGKLLGRSSIVVSAGETQLNFLSGNEDGTGSFGFCHGDYYAILVNASKSGSTFTMEFKPYIGTGTTKVANIGSSSNKWTNLFLSGNLSDGTNTTTISAIKSHLDNTTVHITSAERTAWNAKISAVKSLKTDATATQSTSSSEALSGSGTVTLHRISKTGKLSHLLSDDGGSVSVITTAEINAILYPSA